MHKLVASVIHKSCWLLDNCNFLSLSLSFSPRHTLPVKKCPVNKTMSIARTFAATASFTGLQKLKNVFHCILETVYIFLYTF